jgi:hypothetical protein
MLDKLIYLDENNKIYSIFNISKFSQLASKILDMPPSICEYHVSNLLNVLDTNVTFNKSNIQDIINLNKYIIYLDYNDKIYLEYENKDDEYETLSLW